MQPSRGSCPLCGAAGLVGDACDAAPCRVSARHAIPDEWASQYRETPEIRRDPRIGTVVDDYLIVARIGAGGFGSVYLALQLPILMKVALKLMLEAEETAVTPNALRRFENEALSLSRLNHPHIVRLLKYGRLGMRPFIAMEYVSSAETLRQLLARRGGRLGSAELRAVVEQLLSALETAHAEHIVHRDLKPENLMIQSVPGYATFVRVLDFGLAKFFEQTYRTTMNVGTPSYLAPEQLTQGQIGPWTDLYTVAVLIFEMATGALPFTETSVEGVLRLKLDPSFDPSRTAPALPAGVRAFFRQAMHCEVRGRYQSVSEFRAAFEAVFATWERTGTVDIERTGPIDEALVAVPRRRRRGWVVALFVVALLGMSLALAALYRSRGKPGGPKRPLAEPRVSSLHSPTPPSDRTPQGPPPVVPDATQPPVRRIDVVLPSVTVPLPRTVGPVVRTVERNLAQQMLGTWRVVTFETAATYDARGGLLVFWGDGRWEIHPAGEPGRRLSQGRWSVDQQTLRIHEGLGSGAELLYFRVSLEGNRLEISGTKPRTRIVALRVVR